MDKTENDSTFVGKGDLVPQEMWRIKDDFSAARGHNVHRLFAQARERQLHSGHPIVSFQESTTQND